MMAPEEQVITPAVIYGAKSTQDRHDSIPTQVEECRQMAEENGWMVVAEFTDEGFSAYSGNRGPGLKQARRAAADAAREYGTTAMLVAQAHDRFARGAGDRPGASESLGEVWHATRRVDVHLRAVEDDEELRDEASVAAIGRRAYIDSRRKSKAVTKGHARRKAKGLHHGQAPLGLESDEGHLRPIEGEAAAVRRMALAYVGGRAPKAIAADLRRDGIARKRGGAMDATTVSAVLRNPIYVKTGIIDAALFEQVTALRIATGKVSRGRRSEGGHLFRGGHLRCGVCAEPMRPRTVKDGRRDFYGCKRHLADRKDCAMPNISRAQVDAAVLAYFEEVWLDVEATRAALAEHLDRHLDEARALRQQAERQAQQAQERLARVRRDYQDGRLDPDDWSEQRADLTAELEAATAEVERLREREQAAKDQLELKDAEAEVLHELTAIRQAVVGHVRRAEGIDAVRSALMQLFDHFVVHPGPLLGAPVPGFQPGPPTAFRDGSDGWIVAHGGPDPWSLDALVAVRAERGRPSPPEDESVEEFERLLAEARRRSRVALRLTTGDDIDGRTVKRP